MPALSLRIIPVCICFWKNRNAKIVGMMDIIHAADIRFQLAPNIPHEIVAIPTGTVNMILFLSITKGYRHFNRVNICEVDI